MNEDEDEELPEFVYEGFYTHFTCPDCGWNDWVEGDTRGEEVECDGCGLKGRMPS